jgi:bacterioferritin-associated ferredoxin
MYVCLCHAVTETQVAEAIGGGACTLEQLRDTLKVTNCCGSCEPAVTDCLERMLTPHPAGGLRRQHATLHGR